MIVKNMVFVDVLASHDGRNLRTSHSCDKIIQEMEGFGFRCDGWQRVRFKKNDNIVSFVRISFVVSNHEPIVLSDTYVSRLADWMALVRLPQEGDHEHSPFKDMYLSAREYQHADRFSD